MWLDVRIWLSLPSVFITFGTMPCASCGELVHESEITYWCYGQSREPPNRHARRDNLGNWYVIKCKMCLYFDHGRDFMDHHWQYRSLFKAIFRGLLHILVILSSRDYRGLREYDYEELV